MVMWLVGTATVTTQGLTARYDTTNEEWGLLSGQNRGPRLGHQWGLFHGHGHGARSETRSLTLEDLTTVREALRGGRPSNGPAASVRTVVLPGFAIAVLKRRQAAAPENANDAVFPTRNGTWQQVNNVERRWRQIRKDTGSRLGHAPHVPQDGGDAHLGASRRRDRLPAARPLLPRHHPRVLHLQAGDRR